MILYFGWCSTDLKARWNMLTATFGARLLRLVKEKIATRITLINAKDRREYGMKT